MQLIPVIDIRNGIAVHAVAGDRQRYAPLRSCWTDSTNPVDVLRALAEVFAFSHCYVADLDAIEVHDAESRRAGNIHRSPSSNRCLIAELVRTGIGIILDAGVRTVQDAEDWISLGVAQVVVSSESLPDVGLLPDLLTVLGPSALTFSIDLKHGRLITTDQHWSDPLLLAQHVARHGVQNMIVLDLAAVGTRAGPVTLELCRRIKRELPTMMLNSGGGIADLGDIQLAASAGLDGLLVATALHDGRIPAIGC